MCVNGTVEREDELELKADVIEYEKRRWTPPPLEKEEVRKREEGTNMLERERFSQNIFCESLLVSEL